MATKDLWSNNIFEKADADALGDAVDTLTGRGATITVAPSNASTKTKSSVDYVCTGTNDDTTINTAWAALPTAGGVVKLLAGDYYFGSSSTSFVNVNNQYGGVTLEGEGSGGQGPGTIIHIPGGTSAPMGIRMAVWGYGSHAVRRLFIKGTATQSTAVVGIWMQCNTPRVDECWVEGIGGHGFVIDGQPETSNQSVTAPTKTTYNGIVKDCNAISTGMAIVNGGPPGDGFVTGILIENSVLRNCWVAGGNGNSSGLLAGALVADSSYTSLTVSPLTSGITSGDKLIIAGVALLGADDYQVVTASADAAAGATTISVNSFTASFSTGSPWGQYFVADVTQMPTRNGFNIGTVTHLDDCHPYMCYQAGLHSGFCCYVIGGEYETCGWCNVFVYNWGGSQIHGIISYGNPSYAHIYGAALTVPGDTVIGGHSISGNFITGNKSALGILLQSSKGVVVADNVITDVITDWGGIAAQIFLATCTNCTVSGNSHLTHLTSTADNYYGIYASNTDYTLITDNNLTAMSGANLTTIAVSGGTGTKTFNNLGYNPAVVSAPATASSVGVADQIAYDSGYIYICTAANTWKRAAISSW